MSVNLDIHGNSMDMDMDGKFHIHGKPASTAVAIIRCQLLPRWRWNRLQLVSGIAAGVAAMPLLCL